MKRFRAMILATIMIAAMAIPSFAATAEPSLTTETNLVNAEASSDAAAATAETAADTATRRDRNAFNGTFSTLFTQLDTLRATAKTNWTAIKTINTDIKNAMKAFKSSLTGLSIEERKAKITALSTVLSPLHASAVQIKSDIIKIRADKKVQWLNYRAAVRAKDQAAAEAALNSILTLKSSIIEKQNALLAVKQQILANIH